MGVWIGGRRMKNISGPSDPERQHMQTGADWTGGTLASDAGARKKGSGLRGRGLDIGT